MLINIKGNNKKIDLQTSNQAQTDCQRKPIPRYSE